MIFSVFDHHARQFDYYEAPGTSRNYGSRGTKYRALTQPVQGLGGIGYAPESLALPLPENARRVGRGPSARGIVATVPRDVASASLNGLGDSAPLPGAPVAPETIVVRSSFSQMVAAACIAAVVGVCVQRMLGSKK